MKSKNNLAEHEFFKMSKEEEKDATTIEEVNVYGRGCGDPRMGCLVDCINLTPWLTTAK